MIKPTAYDINDLIGFDICNEVCYMNYSLIYPLAKYILNKTRINIHPITSNINDINGDSNNVYVQNVDDFHYKSILVLR